MGFEYLDKESETVLNKYLNRNEISNKFIAKDLINSGYLEGGATKPFGQNMDIEVWVDRATTKGKSYFEMKERYENQIEMSKSIQNINIKADNQSPVNIALHGSTATQTVDYANNEQLEALSSLFEMVNSAKEFTDEEREEILELIEGAKNATKNKKKILLKTLMSALGAALRKAPAFIITKWDEIQVMFGG